MLQSSSSCLQLNQEDNEIDKEEHEQSTLRKTHNTKLSRRDACRLAVGSASAFVSAGLIQVEQAGAAATSTNNVESDSGYVPAVRPTAYRVDSTQPPTLIPLSDARKEIKVLTELGKGSGTDKQEIILDTVNLNNMLNKAVFGSLNTISSIAGNKKDESKIGPGYASFVCMGVPADTTSKDIDLTLSLLSSMVQARSSNNIAKDTALGLAFYPISVQSALDEYSKTGDDVPLKTAAKESGVADEVMDLYMPLLRYARDKSLQLLALSPEYRDIEAARTKGLQSVNPDRRQIYVADSQGFISLTQTPKYKLYTDRSLLKDFKPSTPDEIASGFFAERILVHEAGATVAARYAVERPESFVAIVAPMPDVRFLLGMNGRIPRICAALNNEKGVLNKVTDNAVTTILLNPTAKETLSQSRYLRLEIGTGPETLDYQTKVADYLWFSSSPKVNMIPRLMNG
jgi:hypothetical protein